MKTFITTAAISLLLASSLSAGNPGRNDADYLVSPNNQAAGSQSPGVVSSARPEEGDDAANRGGQSGAQNAQFVED